MTGRSAGLDRAMGSPPLRRTSPAAQNVYASRIRNRQVSGR
jgi:hypothetical protein